MNKGNFSLVWFWLGAIFSYAAFAEREAQSLCKAEADRAKRRAAEVAIAIDGLADRVARARGELSHGCVPSPFRCAVLPEGVLGPAKRVKSGPKVVVFDQ